MRKIVLLAMLIPLRAQAQEPMTLLQAVQRAMHAHPALELADATTARAESGVREARSSVNPSLSLEATATRFGEPMLVAPLHGLDLQRNPPVFDRSLGQATATLAYTLFDASRNARIRRARELVGASQGSAQVVRMQVIADAARAFLRLRASHEVAQAHDRRIAALTRERDRAAQLVEQGRAARVGLLRADAALSAAKAEGVSARSDVDVAENDLARQLGMTVDSIRLLQVAAARASKDQPTIDAQHARLMAHDSSPNLQRARGQIAVAKAAVDEARGLRMPKVQLGGQFIEYASPNTSQAEWLAGLQLSYAVLGGGRHAANDRAVAELRVAQAEYAMEERRVDEAIDRAISVVNAARARVQALEAAVAQSEEVTRIDRLALDAGAGVQSDYLSAEADLFRARAALTDAHALELLAHIELARATGQLSEVWIANNVESRP